MDINERLAILDDVTGSVVPIEIPFPVAHLGKKNGFALIIVIQILRGNKLHNISLCIHIRDWQFCIILLGVYCQFEIPFPVVRLKNKIKLDLP